MPLNQPWFLIFLYVGGGIPMNAWLMKGYFDTVPISLDESAKLDGAGHFRRFWQIVLPLVRPMIAVQALWAFMGPFGDYILSKFLLRDEINYTVAVGLQTFISDQKIKRLPSLRQVRFWLQFQSVFCSSSFKRTLFQAWQLVGIKDKINFSITFQLWWKGRVPLSCFSPSHINFIFKERMGVGQG